MGLEACRDYPSGATCRVACRAGFVKSADLECHFGNWSDDAVCEVPRCGAPPKVHPTGARAPLPVPNLLCADLHTTNTCTIAVTCTSRSVRELYAAFAHDT